MKRLLGMGAVLLCLCLAAGCVAAEDRKPRAIMIFQTQLA